MKKRLAFISISFLLFAQLSFAQSTLKTGTWRGALKTASGNELPFNFVVTTTSGKQQLVIINGSERFKVTDIVQKGDSVFIHMPFFDSEFRLKISGNNLKGYWIQHLAKRNMMMAFSAQPGVAWRFYKNPAKPAFNVSGRWQAVFNNGAKRNIAVGEFKQDGSKLTGTFLTTTGDYRYLEGTVNGDKLYLSCFDGSNAFLFIATINNANTISDGKYYSGLSEVENWTAVKNNNAKLPDAYSLTALKPGYKKLAFTFKDLNGNKVSLSDKRYKNKVVIVQMLGSWCPNCMDETAYMVNYYKKYHKKGVEVIGLAYERTADFTRSQKTVLELKKRLNIPYQLLITGYSSASGEPAKSLPMVAKILGFPTTIIIDKKGDVRKIHTGFNGPGTGKYYTDYITEFEKLTDNLLAEH